MASSNVLESMPRYDFVIFGATGFTGQFCVEEMIKVLGKSNITWAVAGRNYDKLKKVVIDAFTVLEIDPVTIPIIVADVKDVTSLGKMCCRAKIIINTVGPFRFYGEPVIKACIENKTHHIDVSGEPQFLERMQLEYHQLAKEQGVYIIGACGFDSIPCEMGLQYLREKFPGDIAGVDVFVHITYGTNGFRVNSGTWNSGIHAFANWTELKKIRTKLNPEKLPKNKFVVPMKKTPFYSNEVEGWCLPMPMPDKPNVIRTQYHLLAEKKIRPFQMAAYLRIGSLFSLLGILLVGAVFAVLSFFNIGRRLLAKYPKLFSVGFFSDDGPTRQQIKETSFVTTIVASGYDKKLENLSDNHSFPPNTKLVVKVKGPDPAYVITSMCMIQAGIVLLKESDKLPGNGGVYTAGGAFVDTTLIDRVTANGLTIVSGNPQKLNNS